MPILTLAIPTKLNNDAHTKQLSIAVWAALTAIFDTSTQDAKKIYTQVINGLKIKPEKAKEKANGEGGTESASETEDKDKILIKPEELSRAYWDEDTKLYAAWWKYFSQVQDIKSSTKTEKYTIGFKTPKTEQQSLSLFYSLEKPNPNNYKIVTIEWEAYIKITKISRKPSSEHEITKPIKPSPAIRKHPTILGKDRELSEKIIFKSDFLRLLHTALKHTNTIAYKAIETWADMLDTQINAREINDIRKQYNTIKSTGSPFIIRNRGNYGDVIAVFFYENKHIQDSPLKPFLVVLQADISSLKALAKLDSDFYEITLKKVVSYENGTPQITYQYAPESKKNSTKITLQLISISNKERPLPDSITLYNVPEDD